jgi:hypothetical protein
MPEQDYEIHYEPLFGALQGSSPPVTDRCSTGVY